MVRARGTSDCAAAWACAKGQVHIGATDRLRRISRSPPCNRAGMRGCGHLQAIEGDGVDLDAEAWPQPRMPAPQRGASGKLPGGRATLPAV